MLSIVFFISNQLKPQLARIETSHSLGQTNKLLERISGFFKSTPSKTIMVHGSLWQGNVSYLRDGSPIIYDPACYYADDEVDLAMLELLEAQIITFLNTIKKIIRSNQAIR